MDILKKLLKSRKATYVEKTPSDVYREVAEEFDQFDPEDIAAIGGLESQHGKYEKPLKGGSARGLFQFLPKTAEYLIPESSKTIKDRNTQSALMRAYLKKTKAKTPEEAYIKHNLGSAGGRKFLSADENTPVDQVLSKKVIKSNSGLYKGKTVKEAKQTIRDKLEEAKRTSDLPFSVLNFVKNKRGNYE